MTAQPTYVYVTYIKASPEQVWQALTDADLTARYWGHRNESDWQPGSTWQHLRIDGSGVSDVTGTVLEAVRPERLVITFPGSAEQREDPSRVTFSIEPHEDIVRLTVRHDGKMVDVTGRLKIDDDRVLVKSKKSGKTTITVGTAEGKVSPLDEHPVSDATIEVVGVEIVQTVCNAQ